MEDEVMEALSAFDSLEEFCEVLGGLLPHDVANILLAAGYIELPDTYRWDYHGSQDTESDKTEEGFGG